MLEDENTQFTMRPLFLTEQGFISVNAILRNRKYADLCRYYLTVSEAILFQFICCLYDCDYFSSLPNSLAKLTALYTD